MAQDNGEAWLEDTTIVKTLKARVAVVRWTGHKTMYESYLEDTGPEPFRVVEVAGGFMFYGPVAFY